MPEDKKKIIQDMPAEELMKIARASSEAVDVGRLTDAAKFIYALNIRAGDERIPASLIYFTYKKWKGGGRPDPKWAFFKDFQQYFEKKMIQGGTHYMLDPKPFDLSKETYWEIRREIREKREKNRRKKAQQSKVPGPNEEV